MQKSYDLPRNFIPFLDLPVADFNVTSTGVTVTSKRLSVPRFVPFDSPGRCKSCKGEGIEIDSIVTKDGITFYCNRMKNHTFVPFDEVFDFSNDCLFRLRCKGKVFNIPCKAKEIERMEEEQTPIHSEPQQTIEVTDEPEGNVENKGEIEESTHQQGMKEEVNVGENMQ